LRIDRELASNQINTDQPSEPLAGSYREGRDSFALAPVVRLVTVGALLSFVVVAVDGGRKLLHIDHPSSRQLIEMAWADLAILVSVTDEDRQRRENMHTRWTKAAGLTRLERRCGLWSAVRLVPLCGSGSVAQRRLPRVLVHLHVRTASRPASEQQVVQGLPCIQLAHDPPGLRSPARPCLFRVIRVAILRRGRRLGSWFLQALEGCGPEQVCEAKPVLGSGIHDRLHSLRLSAALIVRDGLGNALFKILQGAKRQAAQIMLH
jgi:hypothetical protein